MLQYINSEVTCCLTMKTDILRLFIDETEVTRLLVGNVSNVHETKVVTVKEPLRKSSIAVFGFEELEGKNGFMQMKCASTRPASRWNFVTTAIPSQWSTFREPYGVGNGTFLPAYLTSNFHNADGGNDNATLAVDASFNMTSSCGPLAPTAKIASFQYAGDDATVYYFHNRVSFDGCTNAPSVAEFTPTRLPTRYPSMSPTVKAPTRSPSMPTLYPSKSPSMLQCSGSEITCCLTMKTDVLRLFIDQTEVTRLLVGIVSNVHETKVVTILEPLRQSSIAVFGYEELDGKNGFMQMKCASTRPASRWNFVTTAIPSQWSTYVELYGVGNGTFLPEFLTSNAHNFDTANDNATVAVDASFNMSSSLACGGSLDPTAKIAAFQHPGEGSTVYFFHNRVSFDGCTNAPSIAEFTPTMLPTVYPSQAPTVQPTI